MFVQPPAQIGDLELGEMLKQALKIGIAGTLSFAATTVTHARLVSSAGAGVGWVQGLVFLAAAAACGAAAFLVAMVVLFYYHPKDAAFAREFLDTFSSSV